MSGKWKIVVLAAIVFALSAARSLVASVEVGDKAPNWSGIPGTDDKKHSLSDFTEAKALVLVFTCNHCPVAQAYEERLVALQREYGPKGVQVVAVNVNKIPADRLDKMKTRAEEKGFNFPYLYDESQKMGHDYGAAVTPHAFVVEKGGKIVYIGSIDDNINAKKVKQNFVRDTLDAVLAGKEPAKTKTKAFGCGIAYE